MHYKVGDRVIVLKKSTRAESCWNSEVMDYTVGNCGTVVLTEKSQWRGLSSEIYYVDLDIDVHKTGKRWYFLEESLDFINKESIFDEK